MNKFLFQLVSDISVMEARLETPGIRRYSGILLYHAKFCSNIDLITCDAYWRFCDISITRREVIYRRLHLNLKHIFLLFNKLLKSLFIIYVFQCISIFPIFIMSNFLQKTGGLYYVIVKILLNAIKQMLSQGTNAP